MRILVDQSGYDLLNIGDAAMLQACALRLRGRWPDAEIYVICYDPPKLAALLPDAHAVTPRWLTSRPPLGKYRSGRLMINQSAKIVLPTIASLRMPRRSRLPVRGLRTGASAVAAVRAADIVVAAGGGYIGDTFWWHGAGVMSVLGYAQSLGKPTAMFGQGIGPLTSRPLRRQARGVLRRLDTLGLREGVQGPKLLEELGVTSIRTPPRPGATVQSPRVIVTGDDAVGLAMDLHAAAGRRSDPSEDPPYIGVNLRISGYSGAMQTVVSTFAEVMSRVSGELSAQLLAIPVSRYAGDGDLDALVRVFGVPRPSQQGGGEFADLTTPVALAQATTRCRAVVTGSYHAAVFALAAGVPCVVISASRYYDGKFHGLVDLYGESVCLVPAEGADFAVRLRHAVVSAFEAPEDVRRTTRSVSRHLAKKCDEAFDSFAEHIDRSRIH